MTVKENVYRGEAMKLALGFVAIFAAIAAATTAHLVAQAPERRALAAPTYYIAAEADDCEPEPNYVDFRGASNLPSGALITTAIVDFDGDAWKDYSDNVYVPVGKEGFFTGRILPKRGMRLRDNLLLLVDFTPFRPKQPNTVLAAVGKKGERLAEVENVLLQVPGDLERPAVNPQLMNYSGDYNALYTIARVPSCGEGH